MSESEAEILDDDRLYGRICACVPTDWPPSRVKDYAAKRLRGSWRFVTRESVRVPCLHKSGYVHHILEKER